MLRGLLDQAIFTPYGEIPWPRLSRLSDEEMKALMIDVVNKTYRALTVLFDSRLGGELIKILAQQDFYLVGTSLLELSPRPTPLPASGRTPLP